QWADVPNVHGDCVVRIERLSNASEVVCTDGVDTLKSGMSFEYCVGESHPAPRRRWYRDVMEHDRVAFSEQTMRYGRPCPRSHGRAPSLPKAPLGTSYSNGATDRVRAAADHSQLTSSCFLIYCLGDLLAAGGAGPKATHPVEAYALVFASSSAHASATPALRVFPHGGVAHPPVSINYRCFHD